MTTHILDFELQLLLCSVARALSPSSMPVSTPYKPIESYLEGEMFQEVSCAIGLVRFRSRSSINPYPNSRRLCPWRVLRSNLITLEASYSLSSRPYREPVGQSC